MIFFGTSDLYNLPSIAIVSQFPLFPPSLFFGTACDSVGDRVGTLEGEGVP